MRQPLGWELLPFPPFKHCYLLKILEKYYKPLKEIGINPILQFFFTCYKWTSLQADCDRKPKSRTLLALYCTKSGWEQVVTGLNRKTTQI